MLFLVYAFVNMCFNCQVGLLFLSFDALMSCFFFFSSDLFPSSRFGLFVSCLVCCACCSPTILLGHSYPSCLFVLVAHHPMSLVSCKANIVSSIIITAQVWFPCLGTFLSLFPLDFYFFVALLMFKEGMEGY